MKTILPWTVPWPPAAAGPVVAVNGHAPGRRDPAGRWLRNAMLGLGALAAAAAVVSYGAQYLMVASAKGIWWIAALEAGLPDVGAAVFACLGIALALQGKRALRSRFLNVACVAASIEMNYLASAGTGWRDTAIWVLPPVFYAAASDTLIGVVRAMAVARQKRLNEALADDGQPTPLGVLGSVLLWLLRLVLAPLSTLAGFRSWVVDEVAFAPGRRAVTGASAPAGAVIPVTKPAEVRQPARRPAQRKRGQGTSKTARFLALVEQRHGPLAGIPPERVYGIAKEIAPEVRLDPGSARSALGRQLKAAIAAPGERQS